MITKTFFDKYKSEDIHLFTLKGDNIEVGIIEYGATINFIKFDGIDVELTYKDCQDYIDHIAVVLLEELATVSLKVSLLSTEKNITLQ